MKRKDRVVSDLTAGVSSLLKTNKVEQYEGIAKVLGNGEVSIAMHNQEKAKLTAENIIIATGSKPIEIPSAIFGKHIVDSTGALSFDKVPETLGVVGAGIIGLELGSVWSRLGSEVTVIEALDDFLPMADKDISKESFKEFKKQGLDIQLSSKVIKSLEDKDCVSVTYENDGKEIRH